MVLSLDALPASVRDVAPRYRDDLVDLLGDRLVSVFSYGSAVFGGWPANDFDAHIIVAEPFDETTRTAVKNIHTQYEVEFDCWYITLDQAKGTDPPQSQLSTETKVDEAWPFHRAHIHAGMFVPLHGTDPRDVVPPPHRSESLRALGLAVEDAQEAVEKYPGYAVLNLCRVMCSLDFDDVVFSKRHAALWGLAALDQRWQPLIAAALRWYAQTTRDADLDTLNTDGPAFVSSYAPDLEARMAVLSG